MPPPEIFKPAEQAFPFSFGAKKRPRNGIFGFDRARYKTRAIKWKRGEGEGKEGNACRQTPRFWKPAFASERSAWLARLVEQCWHVSIKGLFHTERSCMVRDTHLNFLRLLFIQARFTQGKSTLLTSFETQSSSCDYIRVSGRLSYSLKCLLHLNN